MTSSMAAEIAEQPAALEATRRAVRPMHAELRTLAAGTDRVVLFARGSSDSAATYGRYLLEIVAGIPSAMGAPSVGTLYDADVDLSSTLVVVCSQSGHTQEMVDVSSWARRRGGKVVAVTNVEPSPLAEVADLALVTRAGAEVAVPATKSHTTCMLALAELALALTPNSNGDRQRLLEAVDEAPAQVQRMLDAAPTAEAIAQHLAAATTVCVVGRSFTYATALEVALKIEETTSMPCLGMAQPDLQHGPVAVLARDRPLLVAAAPCGPTLPGLRALAAVARDRGSDVVLLGGNEDFDVAVGARLPGPELPEAIAPLALIVPGQLLAEAMCRLLGRDPDRPSGLSKVTQTS